MQYVPATIATLGILALVGFALYMTQNPKCLWALLFLFFPANMIPLKKNERIAE